MHCQLMTVVVLMNLHTGLAGRRFPPPRKMSSPSRSDDPHNTDQKETFQSRSRPHSAIVDRREFFRSGINRATRRGGKERQNHVCIFGSKRLPGHFACDGIFNCRDLSDEYLCPPRPAVDIDRMKDLWTDITRQINQSNVIEGSGVVEPFDKNENSFLSEIGLEENKKEDAVDFVQRSCIPGLNRTLQLDTGKTVNPCDFCNKGEFLCSLNNKLRNESELQLEFQLCVTKLQICDGIQQCYGGEDEEYCQVKRRGNSARRRNYSYEMRRMGQIKVSCSVLGKLTSVVDVTQSVLEEHGVSPSSEHMFPGMHPRPPPGVGPKFSAIFRDHLPLGLLAGYIENNIGNAENQSDAIALSQRCDHVIDCEMGYDELMCPGRFYCDSGVPLYVNASQESDGIADCEDNSDEWSTRKRKKWTMASQDRMIRDWYIQAVIWVVGIVAVFGNSVVIFGTFVNLLKLHKKQPLRSLHIAANSIKQRIISKTSNKSNSNAYHFPKSSAGSDSTYSTGWKRSVKIWNSGLVLNLAFADFLMGIYLVVLGSISLAKSSDYWDFDKTWRSSFSCNTLGVLVMLSSQTSVYSLVGLTTLRLYTVARPFGVEVLKKIRYLIFACTATWLISLTVAMFPILPGAKYIFTTEAYVPFPHIRPAVVNRTSASHLVMKLVDLAENFTLDLSQSNNDGALSWPAMANITRHISPEYSNWKFFGFYSAHSVCIPKLFVTVGDIAWQYTAVFLAVNFIAVVYICIAYTCIYKLSTKSHVIIIAPSPVNVTTVSEDGKCSITCDHKDSHDGNAGKKKASLGRFNLSDNGKIQFRIALLIATDCLCWIPICIMGFLHLAGYDISKSAYTASAIGLLPVNSALNPLLYSSLLFDLWRRSFMSLKKSFQTLSSKVFRDFP